MAKPGWVVRVDHGDGNGATVRCKSRKAAIRRAVIWATGSPGAHVEVDEAQGWAKFTVTGDPDAEDGIALAGQFSAEDRELVRRHRQGGT